MLCTAARCLPQNPSSGQAPRPISPDLAAGPTPPSRPAAGYEASLAERRYAACDPDNRLIAAQLEKSWEEALRRVETCEAPLQAVRTPDPAAVAPNFAGLADDLEAAWTHRV